MSSEEKGHGGQQQESHSSSRRPPPPPPPPLPPSSSPPLRPPRPPPPPTTTRAEAAAAPKVESTTVKTSPTTDILAQQREIMMRRRQEDMRAEAVRSVESASSSSSPSYYTPAIKQFSTPRTMEEESFSSFGPSPSSSSSTPGSKEAKDVAAGSSSSNDVRVVPLPLGPPPTSSSRLMTYRANLSSSSSFRDGDDNSGGAAEPKEEMRRVPLPPIAKEEEEEEEEEQQENEEEEDNDSFTQGKDAIPGKHLQEEEEEFTNAAAAADDLRQHDQASLSNSSSSSSFSSSFPGVGRQVLDLDTLLATRTGIHKFVTRPVPQNAGAVQCYIKRRKGSGATKLCPEYYLYTRQGDHFLMAAKKQFNNKTSNYHITLNDREFAKESLDYLGKLRANFVGTEFQLFDRGVSAKDASVDSTALIPPNAGRSREELAVVVYAANVLGSRGPRKMQVFLPRVNKRDDMVSHWKEAEDLVRDDAMLDRARRGDIFKFHHLINKPPRWNDQVGAYVLNFNGRVTMASVKNFQLIDPEDHETVVLQFGRVGQHDFTMDVRWPFSPLQALGVTLSSFDSKIACD